MALPPSSKPKSSTPEPQGRTPGDVNRTPTVQPEHQDTVSGVQVFTEQREQGGLIENPLDYQSDENDQNVENEIARKMGGNRRSRLGVSEHVQNDEEVNSASSFESHESDDPELYWSRHDYENFIADPNVQRCISSCHELRSIVLHSISKDLDASWIANFFSWDQQGLKSAIDNERQLPTSTLLALITNPSSDTPLPRSSESQNLSSTVSKDRIAPRRADVQTHGPYNLTKSKDSWGHHYIFLIAKYTILMRMFVQDHAQNNSKQKGTFREWKDLCRRYEFPWTIVQEDYVDLPENFFNSNKYFRSDFHGRGMDVVAPPVIVGVYFKWAHFFHIVRIKREDTRDLIKRAVLEEKVNDGYYHSYSEDPYDISLFDSLNVTADNEDWILSSRKLRDIHDMGTKTGNKHSWDLHSSKLNPNSSSKFDERSRLQSQLRNTNISTTNPSPQRSGIEPTNTIFRLARRGGAV
jgi:hypothetical protein